MPAMAKMISRDRFHEIWRTSKFSDAEEDEKAGKTDRENPETFDRLAKIRPIMTAALS